METIIEKLKKRLSEEEAKSLNNVRVWRQTGPKDAELMATGEVVAFALAKDIIEELERETES